jgi:hypothetical protein
MFWTIPRVPDLGGTQEVSNLGTFVSAIDARGDVGDKRLGTHSHYTIPAMVKVKGTLLTV